MRYSEERKIVGSNYSYVINNQCDFGSCDSEAGNSKRPGIKMSVVKNINYDLEEFYKDFEYQIIEKENSYFKGHFRRVLRRESDSWKLICVKIYHRQMWMDFACTYNLADKAVDKSMICQESVIYDFGKREGYIKLCFEAGGLNDSGTTRTTVSFSSMDDTIITEIDPYYQKKIYLPGRKIDGFYALRTEKWY